MPLTKKIALITGAAQGIGRAIAAEFAAAGAAVVIADRQAETAAATAAALHAAHGRPTLAIPTDVTSLESVHTAVSQTIDQFGRIDVLVNNAGWDRFAFFLDTTPDFWDKVIAVNYRGVLNTCHAVLPHMVAQQAGAIVNIASDAGRAGSSGEAVYAGCKGAVIAFSKTLAREHARDGIRVNVVAPGITDTALLAAMQENSTGAKIISAVAKAVPLGRRPGTPAEIAPAVRFLASDAAAYITGQVLSINGGLTMND
ncbi:MAG: glucose 1-dehydrogenase [Anaerolineales bacterium]|nr:glucose 1-dehydrogenase [Anaerolineales bacterium]